MTNLNDRNIHNQNNTPSPNGQPINGVSGTNETVNRSVARSQTAYRDGYVQGSVDQDRYVTNQEIRDNDNAGRGLLMGILLTSLVGLGVGAYFLTQRSQTPTPVNRTIIVPKASPSPQPPQVRERVIERDRVVPVPQPQAPAPAPDINITLPNPQNSTSSPSNSSGSQGTTAPSTSSPSQSTAPASPSGATTAPGTDSSSTGSGQ